MVNEFEFGYALPGQAEARIERALQEAWPGTLSRTDIRDLFSRRAPRGVISAALKQLHAAGKVEFVMVPTAGRPAQLWRLTSKSDTFCQRGDSSD